MSQLPETRCLKCEKSLESVLLNNEDDVLMLKDAVSFSGHGTYGSSYDESPLFVINICDDCLTDAINKQNVLELKKTIVETRKYSKYRIPKY